MAAHSPTTASLNIYLPGTRQLRASPPRAAGRGLSSALLRRRLLRLPNCLPPI